jgi:MFS family permease
MQNVDPVVIKETKYIALWTVIFSVLMQAVFLIVGYFLPDYAWNWTVLTDNLLGVVAVVANFFFMALGVQRAMEKDPDDAKKSMRASSSGRMLGLFIVAVIGVVLDCFHTVAVLVPMLFPRIAIAIRPLWDKKMSVKEGEHEQ